MTARPTYKISGTVVDVADEPVAGAKVVLSGYDNKETETATDGTFSFADVFKDDNYAVSITKNKLLEELRTLELKATQTLVQ